MANLPRVGVVMSSEVFSPPVLAELARELEAQDYDTLWVGETWSRDAFGVLTNLAHHTSRVRLGTSVISIFSRTPGALAQSIATLDELSGGRAVLGLGPSSQNLVEGWHGVPFDRPIARMRELVPLLRRILSGERLDFEGEFYRIRGLALPFPARAGLPIYLASLSPQHLELTGELADGWLPTMFSWAELPAFRSHIERGIARAGRSSGDVTLAPWVLTCACEDADRARALARDHIAFFVAAYGDAYNKLVRRYGFSEEADRLIALWKSDRANLSSGVSDALLDAIAIAGTPEHCRERFASLYDRGLDLPAVLPPARAPFEVIRETVHALAPGKL